MLRSQLEIERAKVKELDAIIQKMKSLLPEMYSDINPGYISFSLTAQLLYITFLKFHI